MSPSGKSRRAGQAGAPDPKTPRFPSKVSPPAGSGGDPQDPPPPKFPTGCLSTAKNKRRHPQIPVRGPLPGQEVPGTPQVRIRGSPAARQRRGLPGPQNPRSDPSPVGPPAPRPPARPRGVTLTGPGRLGGGRAAARARCPHPISSAPELFMATAAALGVPGPWLAPASGRSPAPTPSPLPRPGSAQRRRVRCLLPSAPTVTARLRARAAALRTPGRAPARGLRGRSQGCARVRACVRRRTSAFFLGVGRRRREARWEVESLKKRARRQSRVQARGVRACT